MSAWIAAGSSVLAIAIGWLVHTQLAGWIPEDAPRGPRKRHARPTPLIGFLPALVAIVLLCIQGHYWLAAGCFAAAATGLLDDSQKENGDGIDWRTKATGLGIAAGLATVELTILTELGPIALGAAFIAVFVICNATNFLDNTDGVASALGGAALLLSGGDAVAVGCAWLAFLPFNWPKARLFLGDSGALPLGLAAGTFALTAAADGREIAVLGAIAPVAVPLADFCQVVIARIALGYAPWVADRRHLTHIALNAGLPSVWAAPVFAGVALLLHAGLQELA